MKRQPRRLLLVLLLFSAALPVRSQLISAPTHPPLREAADYVDPLIGTAKSIRPTMWESNGATFPGVLAPFGMVQITPDGYHYTDTHIRGFSFIDHSSGWGSSGHFLILPYTGPTAAPAAFTHDHETCHPWQYDVDLASDLAAAPAIHASFTATIHAGFARFNFPASGASHILFSDLSNVTIISDTCLTGCSHGTWFTAHFSKPFRIGRIDSTHAGRPDTTCVRLDYTTTAGETIDIRIAFSTTSIIAATANLDQEMPIDNFEKYSREDRDRWNKTLGQIEIIGGDETHRKVFYTALYHSCFMPSILSDAGVSPRRYTPLYPWDTYRSEHPLLTLLDPTAQGEMIASTLDEYDRTGWLPTGNMLGNHNVEIILDSYVKGVRNFDSAKAVAAIRKSLLTAPYARRDMRLFNDLGFVPAAHVNSVSQTLEFAYDCWAGARFLQATGAPNADAAGSSAADIDTLLARSFAYQKLYDAATGFMRARTDSGIFTDGGYCEGTPWTYTWYVPHDIHGLVNLMGGPKHFADKLAECFDKGYYIHDNEPPLHYAYLFDYVGQPWKTQQYARTLTETSYSAVPGGLPGNDDLGALSSWYVLSALGFYPVTPGEPIYEIGSPVFSACILHLPNGKTFTIHAPNTSSANRYIHSATLNGRPYTHPWITHADIEKGGVLTLEMSALPNKQWGAAPDDAPPSETIGHPVFTFAAPALSMSTTPAGEPVQWSCRITNDGPAAGSIQLDLYVDGKRYGARSAVVNPGETLQLSISVILYQAGAHTITLGQTAFPQKLLVQAKPPTFVYSDLSIPLPPVITQKDSIPVSATIRNTGSSSAATQAVLYAGERLLQSQRVPLEPGQEKDVHFLVTGSELQACGDQPPGRSLATVTINDLPPLTIHVLDDRPLPPIDTAWLHSLGALTVLNFDQGPGDRITDVSGTGNDGVVHGTPRWVTGLFGKAIQLDATKGAYIELRHSPSLDTLDHNDSMTMMAWVYPMEEENFADILCKGDWHTLQVKAGNTIVNFYTAGWEGHEASAPVPLNWNRHWHHIAGVTRYPYEELYIDGRLAAVKKMEPRDPNGETGLTDYSDHPWSIGRNDNDPTRLFKGYIDDVMIFGKALNPEQINRLMLH